MGKQNKARLPVGNIVRNVPRPPRERDEVEVLTAEDRPYPIC
jgi:hypothetical protein